VVFVFSFKGESYSYFHHPYNTAGERTVEVPIAKKLLDEYSDRRVLEIGNVLSHYYDISHDIVDKYEVSDGVINEDIIDFTPQRKYDLILCISTLEHVGHDEGYPRDDRKAVYAYDRIIRLLTHGGKAFITWPLGWNPYLDNSFKNGRINFNNVGFLTRTSVNNQWIEVSWEEVKDSKYGHPFYAGNATILGTYDYSPPPKNERLFLKRFPPRNVAPVPDVEGVDSLGREYRFTLEMIKIGELGNKFFDRIDDVKIESLQLWLDHLGPALYNPISVFRLPSGGLVSSDDGYHRMRALWELGESEVLCMILESEDTRLSDEMRPVWENWKFQVLTKNSELPTKTHFAISDWNPGQYYPCIYPVPDELKRFYGEDEQDGSYYRDTLDSTMSLRDILSQNKRLSYRLDIADCIARYAAIRGKTVLDVGPQYGHFSFLLYGHGVKEITAVELDPFKAKVMGYISERRILPVAVYHMGIQDYVKTYTRRFDVILLLNVFHWLLAHGKPEAWETLNTLIERSKTLFLMMGVKEWDALKEFDWNIPRAINAMTDCNLEVVCKTGYRGRTLYALS